MTAESRVISVNGPVVRAFGTRDMAMRELVRVGDLGLLGEIVRMEGEEALVQMYEDTQGLRVGEPVRGTGGPLSVLLGPGLAGSIIDGIGRPLSALLKEEGDFITRGVSVPQLDLSRSWEIRADVSAGDIVTPGALLATVRESPLLDHRILVPFDVSGEVEYIVPSGFAKGSDIVARVRGPMGRDHEIRMTVSWPVRSARPYAERLLPDEPLVTGQRVIDGLFPIAKGGVAAIPGGFGTGKTVTQHQLAKWSDASVVVYIGCGERGNEMTQVLEEFPALEDPRTGRPLMERTILIANTSNMPVAAREASIYTGITIAEYYRDMGYDVALMADSTSRWAEALREISGRLEEIPAEEGFPAYLPTRLAEFYERAGRVVTIGGEHGSISIIGAVSPPGGDFTEPVTRHTKRFIRCFWALDRSLANSRHFPAISWTESYSEYAGEVEPWFEAHVDASWGRLRNEARAILAEDEKIRQIIRLVGEDVLPNDQRLVDLTASLIRNGYLQQGAFGADSFCPPEKGFAILNLILRFHRAAEKLVTTGCPLSLIRDMGELVELIHAREIPADRTDALAELGKRIDETLSRIGSERMAPEGRG